MNFFLLLLFFSQKNFFFTLGKLAGHKFLLVINQKTQMGGMNHQYGTTPSFGWMSSSDYREFRDTRTTDPQEKQNETKAQPEQHETKTHPEDLQVVSDTRTPEEIYEHILHTDSKLMHNVHRWEEIDPERITDLKIGTWMFMTKFNNFRSKDTRKLILVEITFIQQNSIGLKFVPPRVENSNYPFKPKSWTMSWGPANNNKSKRDSLVGHVCRRYFVKQSRFS